MERIIYFYDWNSSQLTTIVVKVKREKFVIINKILEYVFRAPSNVTILRVLNERVAGISGRETARLTGLSLRTVQVSLANLEQAGIVKKFSGKREHLFILDRKKHLTKNLVEKIFLQEHGFHSAIKKSIKQKLGRECLSIILFGSIARRDEKIDSDYDVCIVFEKSKLKLEEKVSDLRTTLHTTFNISLAPFYISYAKFKEFASKDKPPVNNIIREGIVLSGKSIKELLNG